MNDTIQTGITELAGLAGWEEHLRFLGIKLIDVSDFSELVIRFLLNAVMVFLVVHYMYAMRSKRKDFYFSYIAIGGIVFLLCFLLNNVKLELGFALGLFAIFAIIRYRTDTIPIKEMTYLFLVIGISVMNAIASKKVSYAELLFVNAIILLGLWLLEKRLMLTQEQSLQILYEKIENIHRMSEKAFLDDLKERTGITVKRFEIHKIDFLRDVADITIYFQLNGQDENGHHGNE
ncbi:MAG: DUF4956 domain-containing protein [Bacteroidia bacterium]|nr:DUF4956 domain-containing protein [Bacteroidia bacterium]